MRTSKCSHPFSRLLSASTESHCVLLRFPKVDAVVVLVLRVVAPLCKLPVVGVTEPEHGVQGGLVPVHAIGQVVRTRGVVTHEAFEVVRACVESL